jgi:hypothetical protein
MRSGKRPFDRLVSAVGSRYGALLVVLIALLTAFPLIGGHRMIRWVLGLVSLALIITALRVIPKRRELVLTGWVIGGPAIGATILSRSLEIDWAHPLAEGLRVGFFGFLIMVIFDDIWRREKITIDALLGACCIYVLLGLAWGSGFALLEGFQPGSFDIPSLLSSSDPLAGSMSTESNLEYYSLITMTTVGYGDITPSSSSARVFAALEGLLAQLYLAIIIARLVSLEIAQRLTGKPDKG